MPRRPKTAEWAPPGLTAGPGASRGVSSRSPRARADGLLVLGFLMAVLLVVPSSRALGGDGRVTLLHTNDIHGAYAARPARWLADAPPVGGFLALSAAVEAERERGDPILLDAGDLLTGDPLTILDYHGVPGGGAVALMNAVGYDAMAIGNHEFDNGRRELEALIGMADFPLLAANLWIADTGKLFAPQGHVLLERGGVRVAVIGLILDGLAETVAAEPIRGLAVEPMAAAARREVAIVDPLSDLVVVLAHAGLDDCRALARQVDGIDVILAAHDHRRTEEPETENGVLIVEAGSQLANFGRLELAVAGDRVKAHRYELVLLAGDRAATAAASPAVRAVYDECDAAIQAEYGQTIATLAAPLERAGDRESNIGDWLTDAMRAAAGADFAIANSSGIRADLPAGPVTRLDIHRIMPFRNLLATFRASGADIERFARLNAARALGKGGSVVQMSGIRFAFDGKGEVHDLTVGGQPVAAGRVYVGATSDYVLFSQPEKYLGFVPEQRERTTMWITDLLAAAAAGEGRITARVDGRLRRIDGPEAATRGEAATPVTAEY